MSNIRGLLIFFALLIIFSNLSQVNALTQSSTATVTDFTVSNEGVEATDVTYTLGFTLSDPIEPNGDNIIFDFDLNRITSSIGDNDSNVTSATGSFSSFQYQNTSTQQWVDIDFGGAGYFHKEVSSSNFQIWGFGYGVDRGTRHGIQTTIPANTPVRLIITGVTNPNLYGSYALSVQVSDISTGDNYFLELPYNHPQRSVRANIGAYCAKLKVLKPTGTDAGMPGMDIYVNSSVAPSIQAQWGIGTRTDYAGAIYLYPDSFTGIDHCPSGSTEAINAQVMIPGDYTNTNHYLAPNQVTLSLDADKDTHFTTPLRMTQASKTISGRITYSSDGTGVVSAAVNAFKINGSGYYQTTTDNNGDYALLVGGGDWGVQPMSQGNTDWAYGSGPTNLKFINDSSLETKVANFSVDKASSTIRCRILKPDSTPVAEMDGYGVGAFSMQGSGGNGQSQGAGVYTIRVPAGSYNVNVWAPPSSTYSTPSMDPVTVKDSETVDVGDIILVEKNATITGSVKVAGVGIPQISVNANNRGGSGWASATSDANGNFTMSVVAGEWTIMPMIGPNSNYAMVDPPQDVSVATNGSVSVNITLQSASATINGSLVDSNGNPASVYGYAFADRQSGGMFGPGGLGGSVERGTFSFKAPAGAYTVNVGLAPGSSYTQGEGVNVTVADNETKNVTLIVKTNDAVISGEIKDENGTALTDVSLFVFANSGANGRNAFQQGTVNNDGTYTINVSSGDWVLGYFVEPSSGYMSSPPNPNDRFTIISGQTATKDITLRAANSTITGIVYKADGVTPETGAFVSVDQNTNASGSGEGRGMFNGAQTNQNGVYNVRISSGSYKVRVNIQPGTGYIAPPEQTVVVAANETATKNFTLRDANATITGNITLGGSATMAFVSAWADDGGFTETMSGFNGNYSLSVSSGTTWHVGAGYETGTSAYRSEETTLTPTNGSSSTVNLSLVKSDYDLPQSLTVQFDSTKPKVIELTDGSELNIPANALASSGNVTLTANPKTSLPSKKGDRPIWYGYEFTATDASGQTITSFNSSITISFPYTDAQLTKLGITADQLVPSYWDSTTGTWKQVSNVTIDTTNKLVVITIDHFTNFALIADYTVAVNNDSNNDNNNSNNSSSNNASTNSSSSGSNKPSCDSQAPSSAPDLFEIRRTKDQATLYFSPASNPVSYYYIAYGPIDNPQLHGVSFDQGYSSGVLSYTISKLKSTDYYFSIRAGNGCMPGEWSQRMLAKQSLASYFYGSSSRNIGLQSNYGQKTPTATKVNIETEATPVSKETIIPTVTISVPAIDLPSATPTPSKQCTRFLWWCW